jgi:hypothetical protein
MLYPVTNQEGSNMTVCVAVICEKNHTIVGASDRMLTAGNVQFSPPSSKAYKLTSSISVMVAGDMSIQAEIIGGVFARIGETLAEQSTPAWLNVKDVALMYVERFNAIKARRGEADFLLPIGLNFETFVARQKELAPELVRMIATELIGKALPGTEAIIAGVDSSGAHIYVVENGTLACHDAAGFAAIGNGWYHANSSLMFAKHSKDGTFPRALCLTYTAKKRAEVAPGVGIETDMFAVQGLGSYFAIGEHVVDDLEAGYQESTKAHAEADQIAERKANEFYDRLIKTVKQSGQEEQQTTESAPPFEGPGSGPNSEAKAHQDGGATDEPAQS